MGVDLAWRTEGRVALTPIKGTNASARMMLLALGTGDYAQRCSVIQPDDQMRLPQGLRVTPDRDTKTTKSGTPGPAGPGKSPQEGELRRSIGPFQLTLYGLGSMLGSGIYGLVGQSAGQVGNAVWLSFVLAAVVALLTALSYASLASRYPRAGGAAFVTNRAFGMPLLSFVVGLTVVCSGLTSIATQARVFALNMQAILGVDAVPTWLLGVGFLLVLAGIVLRGIRESMWVNVVATIIEAAGLLVVMAVGLPFWGSVDLLLTADHEFGGIDWLVVAQGSVLTFFAFIGFEDTVNVAEECRDPARSIPIALIAAMTLGTLIYVGVAITSVSVVPWRQLAGEASPLAAVIERAAPVIPPLVFTAITLFAVGNTALVNYVTSSRMVYGMASQGLLPEMLSKVDGRSRTPRRASLLLLAILLVLVAVGNIGELASATVLLLLVVFAVVNGALVVLGRRAGEPRGQLEIPVIIPALGSLLCLALIGTRLTGGNWLSPAIAGGLIAGIVALFFLLRRGPPARV